MLMVIATSVINHPTMRVVIAALVEQPVKRQGNESQ
jgi:hypothetical protein